MKLIFALVCLGSAVLAKHLPLNFIEHKGRIIGGSLATTAQFPWQAGVYYDIYFVGGALINPRWVLTSGHVVDGVIGAMAIHLGANRLDSDERIIISAQHWEIHPQYSADTLENDLGLIQLDEPAVLNSLVKTISLSPTTISTDQAVTVSGWGATGDWGGANNDLMFVRLTTISNSLCEEFYGTTIKENMVCAHGNSIQGVCPGDNGSPLVDGNEQLIGIVLFVSSEGCEAGHPSGFTRVAPYISWINSIVP